MSSTPSIILLGPQRFQPTLRDTIDSIGVRGPLAVVTAGWQEREAEVDELREHVGHPTFNLELYRRHIEVERRDPDLAVAFRARQDRLQRLQRLYRMRLDYALAPARRLLEEPGKGKLLVEHRRAAIRMVRTLDRQHVTRIRSIHQEFDETWAPSRRESVAEQRAELQELIGRCSVLAIAGGNVGVLLSRLRLFDLEPMLDGRTVIAWSAGAMALAGRIVLFHDHPPQGAGNAEVFDAGLGAFRNLVPLPHASSRLRLDDPARVALFARRFAPAICAILDPGARLDRVDGAWRSGDGTRRLLRGGTTRRLASA